MTVRTITELRSLAVMRSLFPRVQLRIAFDRLRFVQIDPMQTPARAQDLILRHRVQNYQIGDLDRWYASGDLEEGVLYAAGFLYRSDWELLRRVQDQGLTLLERKVLDLVKRRGLITAKALDAQIGRVRTTNDWGRQSTAATVTLDRLRRRGLLRIASRWQGQRIFALAPQPAEAVLPPEARFKRLILLVAQVLGPLPETTLNRVTARFRRVIPEIRNHRAVITGLCQTGHLVKKVIDGIPYLWMPGDNYLSPVEMDVRFLAPFDPLVWDRNKFQHLWGWEYRFEAYTSPEKRVRGQYAMPLLFGDQIIGWANVTVVRGRVNVELGFVSGRRPPGSNFTKALDREIADMESFLMNVPEVPKDAMLRCPEGE